MYNTNCRQTIRQLWFFYSHELPLKIAFFRVRKSVGNKYFSIEYFAFFLEPVDKLSIVVIRMKNGKFGVIKKWLPSIFRMS